MYFIYYFLFAFIVCILPVHGVILHHARLVDGKGQVLDLYADAHIATHVSTEELRLHKAADFGIVIGGGLPLDRYFPEIERRQNQAFVDALSHKRSAHEVILCEDDPIAIDQSLPQQLNAYAGKEDITSLMHYVSRASFSSIINTEPIEYRPVDDRRESWFILCMAQELLSRVPNRGFIESTGRSFAALQQQSTMDWETAFHACLRYLIRREDARIAQVRHRYRSIAQRIGYAHYNGTTVLPWDQLIRQINAISSIRIPPALLRHLTQGDVPTSIVRLKGFDSGIVQDFFNGAYQARHVRFIGGMAHATWIARVLIAGGFTVAQETVNGSELSIRDQSLQNLLFGDNRILDEHLWRESHSWQNQLAKTNPLSAAQMEATVGQEDNHFIGL